MMAGGDSGGELSQSPAGKYQIADICPDIGKRATMPLQELKAKVRVLVLSCRSQRNEILLLSCGRIRMTGLCCHPDPS